MDRRYYVESMDEKRFYYQKNLADAENFAAYLKRMGYPACVVATGADGRIDGSNLFASRYLAKKAAYGDEVVVKVSGGWRIMNVRDYQVWAAQK